MQVNYYFSVYADPSTGLSRRGGGGGMTGLQENVVSKLRVCLVRRLKVSDVSSPQVSVVSKLRVHLVRRLKILNMSSLPVRVE